MSKLSEDIKRLEVRKANGIHQLHLDGQLIPGQKTLILEECPENIGKVTIEFYVSIPQHHGPVIAISKDGGKDIC